jgi:predicted phosphodiesterase
MTTRKLLLQVYSDIHLEIWNKMPEIEVKADYLILAGDICQLNHPILYRFLDYCSKNWKKTFYVPGNHEYYSHKKNMNELEFEYKYHIGEKYKNIFYLNNSVAELDDDINVYGTTFWTNPPFRSRHEARQYINDYNHITYFKQGLDQVVELDVPKVKELSNDSFKHLQDYLAGENKKTIVITHFPPTRTGTSHPKYLAENRSYNLYFAWPNDTLSNFKLNNVLAWISGHTHWSYDFHQNGIRLISNQLGYLSEIGETGIKEGGLYEINVS